MAESARDDIAEQWHGVYLVEFSNGCQKVGYSTDPQGRVYGHARNARNFRQRGHRLFERVCTAYERTRSSSARRRTLDEAAWSALRPSAPLSGELDHVRGITPDAATEASWGLSGPLGRPVEVQS